MLISFFTSTFYPDAYRHERDSGDFSGVCYFLCISVISQFTYILVSVDWIYFVRRTRMHLVFGFFPLEH